MAYPTPPTEPITEIATDTTYSAPGEDWDGADTKVAPTTAIETQGYVPGDPRPADVDNWLFNAFAKWLQYLSDFVDELKLQKVQGPASSTDNAVARFDSTTGKVIQNSALICADTTGILTYGTAQAKTVILGFDAGNPTFGTWTRGEAGAMLCSTDVGTFTFPLSDYLPNGAVLTDVDVLLTPGAARATSGNRTLCGVVQQSRIFSTAAAGTRTAQTSSRDDGTNVIQVVPAMDASTYTVIKGEAAGSSALLFLTLTAGNDASSNNDTFYAVRLSYNDPGPSAR